MALIIFVIVLIIIVFIIFLLSKKYINPYRLYMVFGKKGSGKTTYLIKLMHKYHKLGRPIFTTLDPKEINLDLMPFVNFIKPEFIGYMVPPPESVLFVDEVGMIWDNRDFKKFKPEVRDYFKLQRHYRNIVYLFSQTFDIDLKLRTLTDAMYLCTNPIPIFSVVKRIKRTIVLVQPVADAEGRIADSLEFIPWYMNLFGMGALQLTYIPKWSKYFNSHGIPNTPVFAYNSIEDKDSSGA